MANFMEVAANLFKTCPGINRVELSDVEPEYRAPSYFTSQPDWYFISRKGDEEGEKDSRPCWIPWAIGLLMPAESYRDLGPKPKYWCSGHEFKGRIAASDALSAACVAYGRQQAGWPQWS